MYLPKYNTIVVHGVDLNFFLVCWDLGTLDAFGVVVFLFGIRLVDFLDVCTPVLVHDS